MSIFETTVGLQHFFNYCSIETPFTLIDIISPSFSATFSTTILCICIHSRCLRLPVILGLEILGFKYHCHK
jgi:hypothetical protein